MIPESIEKMFFSEQKNNHIKISKPYYSPKFINKLKFKYTDKNYILAVFPSYGAKIRLLYDKNKKLWIGFRAPNVIDQDNYNVIFLLDDNFIPILYHSLFSNRTEIFRLNTKNQIVEGKYIGLVEMVSMDATSYTLNDIYILYEKVKRKQYTEKGNWEKRFPLKDPYWIY